MYTENILLIKLGNLFLGDLRMKLDCLIVDDEIALAETTCEYFNMFEVKTAFVTSARSVNVFYRKMNHH